MPIQPHRRFAVGSGYDIHRLEARDGGRLMIGGVLVARGISPVAHSDGDVLLHALVDALLGAAGLGDIGEHFPNTDIAWSGAESAVFVRQVIKLVKAEGWSVGNVDTLTIAEKPKLKEHKSAIRESIARLLEADVGQVNVKAGTNEGVDALGQGLAIAAQATILLMR